jgi:hypothetical protein
MRMWSRRPRNQVGAPRRRRAASAMKRLVRAQMYLLLHVSTSAASAPVLPSPLCAPASPKPVTLQLLFFHPPAPNSSVLPSSSDDDPLLLLPPPPLSNHDMADALGSALFVCADNYSLAHYGDKLLSSITVQANPAWGGYASCTDTSPGACTPGARLGGSGTERISNNRSVGRHMAQFWGVCGTAPNRTGQCEPNTHTGSWYSFLSHGRCPRGATVGTGGCTWRPLAVQRTISTQCAMERGLLASCARGVGVSGGGCSYAATAKLLEVALGLAEGQPCPRHTDNAPHLLDLFTSEPESVSDVPPQPPARSQTNNGSVTVIKYENLDCTGAVVSNTSFSAGECYGNNTLGASGSFKYNCHHLVRPTCAFFRLNCSDGNQRGRVEERPCEICSVTGVFTVNPQVFNYSCDATSQSVVFNTNCTNGHTRGVCGHCNHSSLLHPNKCVTNGDGVTSELIKVGPCAVKVATMAFDSSNNCSSTPGHFAGLIASGQCDNRRGERRSCHLDEHIC